MLVVRGNVTSETTTSTNVGTAADVYDVETRVYSVDVFEVYLNSFAGSVAVVTGSVIAATSEGDGAMCGGWLSLGKEHLLFLYHSSGNANTMTFSFNSCSFNIANPSSAQLEAVGKCTSAPTSSPTASLLSSPTMAPTASSPTASPTLVSATPPTTASPTASTPTVVPTAFVTSPTAFVTSPTASPTLISATPPANVSSTLTMAPTGEPTGAPTATMTTPTASPTTPAPTTTPATPSPTAATMAPTATTPIVLVETTFNDVSIDAFADDTYNSTFRSNYTMAVSKAAGVTADQVTIERISAGSVVVTSTVEFPSAAGAVAFAASNVSAALTAELGGAYGSLSSAATARTAAGPLLAPPAPLFGTPSGGHVVGAAGRGLMAGLALATTVGLLLGGLIL